MVKSKQNSVVEEILFSADEFLLKGYLHLPPVPHPPLVIGCHGLFSDKNSPKQMELARQCNRRHMAYFRFDHRGCGESNAPADTISSLPARCRDLKAAVKALQTRGNLSDQLGLFGSSMGGSVCLAMARSLAARAVVTWAAPVRSTDLVAQHDPPSADAEMPIKTNPFDISNRLAGLRNILILHGAADETVPLSHANEIYDRVGAPKTRLVFPHSDHRMSRPSDQRAFLQAACDWFQTHLAPLDDAH